MNKNDFIKMIDTLDIAKIKYFNIGYEDYGVNNNTNELTYNNN